MTDNNSNPLEQRVEALEQLIEKLQEKVSSLEKRLDAQPSPASGKNAPSPDQREQRRPRRIAGKNGKAPKNNISVPDKTREQFNESLKQRSRTDRPMYALNSDEWLNRIGLTLLFLGAGFLLNYIFTLDWFTALLRVMSGSLVGLFLLAMGLHFHRIRPSFGQILLGGGVATFYLTAFGAYQLYHLISYPTAFVILFIITAFSFGLSAQRDDSLLAILATIGGLVTPFVMHYEEDNLIGLISYTSLILIGSSAIYWFRGWRTLLFISSIGAWLVILYCYLNVGLKFESISSERWTLQVGLFVALSLFWIMPVFRGILRSNNPEKWPAPPPVRMVGYFFNHPALPLSILTPLTTLALSILVWDLSESQWGRIILLSSTLFITLYLIIKNNDRTRGLNHLAQVQGVTAISLITAGLFYLFDSSLLLASLAIVAFVIRLVAVRTKDRLFSLISHCFFFALIGWTTARLFENAEGITPIINSVAMSELTLTGLCAIAAVFITKRWLSTTYLICAHVLFMGIILKEFNAIEDGEAVVTTAWGIYGIALLLYGLGKDSKFVRYMGIYTLTMVAFKLLFMDLEEVEPLIRILLFLGFGVIFMILSYLISAYFKKRGIKQPPPVPQMHQETEKAVSK